MATVLIGSFSFLGQVVSNKVEEVAMALPQGPERSDDGQVVVTDEFLNQFGLTAAGPQDDQSLSFISVNPDGTIKISISPKILFWSGTLVIFAILSLVCFRLAIRR